MKREDIFKELAHRKKILEEKGYYVIYIGLYGSQNYNLDDEESDIDVKAIILPSLHDIIFRKVTSTTIECENGNIDVKDLLTFYEVIRKGNFTYIEAMQTEYSIGDKYIKELFSNIKVNLKSLVGAMYEKRKALTHEYPSKTKEFEKWGFDPKQHHHILRLYNILYLNSLKNQSNTSFITYDNNDNWRIVLMNYKRNKNNVSKSIVEEDSDKIIEAAKLLIPDDYKYEPIDLSEEVYKYIENKLRLVLYDTSTVVSAIEVRTFDNGISKKHLEMFPVLENYKDKDISYIIYSTLSIL